MAHRGGRRSHDKRGSTPAKGSSREQRSGSASKGAEHPLVQLQREIGNAAVSTLVREHHEQALMVQRLAGNRAIAQLLQSNLEIVAENSAAEREAEAFEGGGALPSKSAPLTPARSPLAAGGGERLAKPVRRSMETQLGQDLRAVRVHRDADARQMSRALGAEAFTHGADVFVSRDASERTVRHEVAHAAHHSRSNAVHLKRVNKHVDFLQIKKKNLKPIDAIAQQFGIGGGDAWGHWWVELGQKVGNNFTPTESYGWWPRSGVNSLAKLFKKKGHKMEGVLNKGEGTSDPHQGHRADEAFHPVMAVEENEAYDTVRDRVLGQVRTFAGGFTGSWNWRFGWGKNCHTFVDRLKAHLGIHHQSSKLWLAGGGVGHRYTPEAIVAGVLDGSLRLNDTNWYEWAALSAAQRRQVLEHMGWSIEEANGHMRRFGRTAIFFPSDLEQPQANVPQQVVTANVGAQTGATGGQTQPRVPMGQTIRLFAPTSWAAMGQENDPTNLVLDADRAMTMGMVNLTWLHNGQEIPVRAAAVDWGNFQRAHGLV